VKNIFPSITMIVLFLCGGCVIIPTPEHVDVGRGSLGNERLASIRTGVTNKEEVLLSLGEPDMVWKHERIFAYRWVMVSGYVVAVTGGAGAATNPHFFLIEFDDRDIVKRFELRKQGIFSSRNPSDEIMGW
jgi:outer membrane protein assembly factor BamE (lipoprotein component of BamABCDE complex)